MNRKIALLAAVIFSILSVSLSATNIGAGVSGRKNMSLNKSVGNSLLRFISTAALEEIKGMVPTDKIQSYLSIDPANLESTSGKITFQVNDMETGISSRNEHLRSDDWLNSAKYPEISFELKDIKNIKVIGSDGAKGNAEGIAEGIFTMHGKSKQISVNVKLIYIKESDVTKKRASGDFFMVDGEFKISLKDFDVKGKKGVVGSKVSENIDISVKLFYNSK